MNKIIEIIAAWHIYQDKKRALADQAIRHQRELAAQRQRNADLAAELERLVSS